MRTKTIKKVVILGSGGLKIGQAGEFDYSGSQAIKALKEEGIYTVLVNPNIATVQTDSDMADRVYLQPLQIQTVARILEQEMPDALLLSFGGQTALNLGLALHDSGVVQQLGITILGTSIDSIKTTEDRELFKVALDQIGVHTARSIAVYTTDEAVAAANTIGYPIMLRSGYSLGGLGSGRINNEAELRQRANETLQAVPQLLIEEYLLGWKEIEYEVVRDSAGNTITVCNMENFDPMGIHTGESIVVAPSQTLTNTEYHALRQIAIKTINHLQIIGECNIQYALNPTNGDYRVIEVNARLSRSSALASKATGYPLAFVATKLMLGKLLHELRNAVTGTTSAFCEPALDYIAVKIPRWDLAKLKSSDHRLGSEMKSVGEVMALGRSFPEALQKALRMLNISAHGLTDHPYTFTRPLQEVNPATDRRIFALYEALKQGETVGSLHKSTAIDPWFLEQLSAIQQLEVSLQTKPLTRPLFLEAKRYGFADRVLAGIKGTTEAAMRKRRQKLGIIPVVRQIDTMAGEFAATTNYLYLTYHGVDHDLASLHSKAVVIIGSGPYCIGSSVEFDWCAVNALKTLQAHNIPSIMVNSNPETVSTDFDRSDRLYFEELTLERLQDIADFEQPNGIIVSVGGQIANNVALPLATRGYPIMGTPPLQIDRAEDRQKFSAMLTTLGIDQPAWQEVTSFQKAKTFAAAVGYPLLIRPSYVLSGGAMNVVSDEKEMKRYLQEAALLSPDHPVVISRFITDAKEIEIDGVARNGILELHAISEHIENAGVHSGDATVVFPAQQLTSQTIQRVRQTAKVIAGQLNITGPFNIQFLYKNDELKVIECNVRASRSFPFVSKVSGHNFITAATEAMLGVGSDSSHQTANLPYVGVKSPQFSYNRLKGADPVASVEMASTGEVACLGDTFAEASYTSWLATDQHVAHKSILLSLPDSHKEVFVDEVAALVQDGWQVQCTPGTHAFMQDRDIATMLVHKIEQSREPSVETAITAKQVALMICIPAAGETDGLAATARRLAVDNHLPLITNAKTGQQLMRCLMSRDNASRRIKALQDYPTGLSSQ